MPTRRTLVLAAAGAALAGRAAAAADPTPRAFLRAIYDSYEGKNGNGVPLDTDETVKRYFEPAIAARIRQDQQESERRNETAALDFDPFVDAQDWDIAVVNIDVKDTAPGKASATVRFNNFGKSAIVALDLVKVGADWKIYDITWKHDTETLTLRGLYPP